MNGLEERRAQAVATAARLSVTTTALLDASAKLRSRACELRIAASEIRFRTSLDESTTRQRGGHEPSAWFTVSGIVDGVPTRAQWSPGHLDCDRQLMQRVEIVVAMGDRFSPPGSPSTGLPASIEAPPVVVLLTVMRAFSRVTSIDLHDGLLESLDTKQLGNA